jgi:hypothetical protein
MTTLDITFDLGDQDLDGHIGLEEQAEIQNQLAIVEAKIKKLQAKQKALRAEAIDGGFAYYLETIRNTAPSLTWWKEQHPKTWMRYAKEGTVRHFTWK